MNQRQLSTSDPVVRSLSGDYVDHGPVAVVVASSTTSGRRRCDRDGRWAALTHTLSEAGFWSGLPSAQAHAQQREVAAGGYPFSCAVLDDVTFFADGEDLAEGDVEDLLREMAPAMRRSWSWRP